MLMDKFINSIISFLPQSSDLVQEDLEKITYALQIILSESSKTLLLFLAFSLFKVETQFLVVLLMSIPIRLISGGIHFNKYWSCLTFSLIYFGSILVFNQKFLISSELTWLIAIISVISVYIIGPVSSSQRPSHTEKSRRRFRLLTAEVILIQYFLVQLLHNRSLVNLYVWVNLMHLIQLLISKGVVSCQTKTIY